jgi:U4/U6.U5 tri-snRNP-associated protein 1
MAGGGKELSLSVEETNRLRAELGMRPLRTPLGRECGATERASCPAGSASQPIHAPPPSTGKQHVGDPSKSANQPPRVSSIAASALLGLDDDGADDNDDEGDEDDTSAWVERMRREAAKELQVAMDPRAPGVETGVDVGAAGGAAPLAGVRVQHSALGAMTAGDDAVLTLADTDVLDESGGALNEEGDVLISVEDREQVARRETLRLRTGAAVADLKYDPTDEAEFGNGVSGDAAGEAGVLSKYNDARAQPEFQIGEGGAVVAAAAAAEGHRQQVAARLRAAARGGDQPENAAERSAAFESDYYTREEFAGFKKKPATINRRRKRRLTSKTAGTVGLAADDVAPSATDERDLDDEVDASGDALRILRLRALREAAGREQSRADSEEEGENDSELQESLARARRASAEARAASAASKGAGAVVKAVKESSEKAGSDASALRDGGDVGVVLTEAEQFARAVGVSDMNAAGMEEDEGGGGVGGDEAGPRSAPPRPAPKRKRVAESGAGNLMREAGAAEAGEVGGVAKDRADAAAGGSGAGAKTAAPLVLAGLTVDDAAAAQPMGLAHTLARLRNIGELNRPKEQAGRVRDQRVDWTVPGGGREVKLTYKDDQGRDVTPKEAFRIMSHKFHGKGPGKNKREAAMRRQLKSMELREMTVPEESKLAAVEAMFEETRKTKSAHIVLSGAAAMRSGASRRPAESDREEGDAPATNGAGGGGGGGDSGRGGDGGVADGCVDGGGARKLDDPVRAASKHPRAEDKVQFSLGTGAGQAGKRARRH